MACLSCRFLFVNKDFFRLALQHVWLHVAKRRTANKWPGAERRGNFTCNFSYYSSSPTVPVIIDAVGVVVVVVRVGVVVVVVAVGVVSCVVVSEEGLEVSKK